MEENSKRFKLACSSPLFSDSILSQIGSIREAASNRDLIFEGKLLLLVDANLNSFLISLYVLLE